MSGTQAFPDLLKHLLALTLAALPGTAAAARLHPEGCSVANLPRRLVLSDLRGSSGSVVQLSEPTLSHSAIVVSVERVPSSIRRRRRCFLSHRAIAASIASSAVLPFDTG
jgi:hypothetical protein